MSKSIAVPCSLSIGDTIALIAPAGWAEPEAINRGAQELTRQGYEVLIAPHAISRYCRFSGTVTQRLSDLYWAFENPEVRAVLCTRGGYGSTKLLSHIDFRKLAGTCKIFMGFSDITALLLSLYMRLHWITFHGPMIVNCHTPITTIIEQLHGEKTFHKIKGKPLAGGTATGILFGGCLSVLQSLIGTEFAPPTSPTVLFWEDVNEPLYKIDRMITHMEMSGFLDRVVALLVGRFNPMEEDSDKDYTSIETVLEEHFTPRKIPIIVDLPFGHVINQVILPVGAEVKVNGDRGTIELLQPVLK